jgi:hypothetical protein
MFCHIITKKKKFLVIEFKGTVHYQKLLGWNYNLKSPWNNNSAGMFAVDVGICATVYAHSDITTNYAQFYMTPHYRYSTALWLLPVL